MDLKTIVNNFLISLRKDSPDIPAGSVVPIQLDITNACNLNCTHCYHANHSNRGAIDFEQWLRILKQYKSLLNKLNARPKFILCGGEPLVSLHLFPLLEFIQQSFNGAPIAILTNGTLVTDAFLLKIQRLKHNQLSFQVSLDGPDKERHDAIRGDGNFELSLDGINSLTKHDMHVQILSILSNKSLTWIVDFFALAQSLKVKSLNFTRFIAQGQGEKNPDKLRTLNSNELKTAYREIVFYSSSMGVKTNTQMPLYHLIHPQLGGYGHFSSGIIVDYRGNLKVSSRADKIIGNILNEDLESLYLHNPIMKALRSGRIWGCKGCPQLQTCGGDRNVAYAEFGDFLAPDTSCWFQKHKKQKMEFINIQMIANRG
ncbi:MAG: radical SAM protein [Bdellovibrionales bacterium]|nr:radical SAM protein [Bdellovibrionales bacterium]